MPLYLNFNKSHPSPWSQTLDALLAPSAAGVCTTEPRNDLTLEPTLTPSPVSSTTTTTDPPGLPFTLALRSLTEQQQQQSPSEDFYHQTHFASRPTSASELDGNGSPDYPTQFSDDHHQLPRLVHHLPQQSPLLSAYQPASGLATECMRSLDILDHPQDRPPPPPPRALPSHYPALVASSADQRPSPDHLAEPPSTDPNYHSHPPPPHKTNRGTLRVNRPIQPIDGPPPPVLHKARGPWHKDEDTALLYWVSHLGTGKWVDIAKRVGSRSGKQCRERWTNQLSPDIDHSAFRHEEDMVIITMQQTLKANKWCEVAKYLPGRPENAIKNRWNSRDLQRKRSELGVNVSSAVAPFGFMLPNHQEASRSSAQVGLPYNDSPKRARSPQTSSIDLHLRLGLPYQTPRNPSSGNGTKKHRVVIEPHTTVHRNHLGGLPSPSKLGFTHQSEGFASNQTFLAHHPVEMSSLSGQGELNQDWSGGYHTTTPPNTCSSNPRVHCLQRNLEFGAGVPQYYSTPAQSPTYQLDSSSNNSLASSETSDPRQQPHFSSTSYDELPTPKSGLLAGPPLAQHLFMGQNLQAPHVKPNMFYNCYTPDVHNKKGHNMDLRSPEQQSNYDTFIRPQALGSGFPSSSPLKSYEADRDEQAGRVMDQHGLGDFNNLQSTTSPFFVATRTRNPTLISADDTTADGQAPINLSESADAMNHQSSNLERFDDGLGLSNQDPSAERSPEEDFQNNSWSSATGLVLSHNSGQCTHLPEPHSQSGV